MKDLHSEGDVDLVCCNCDPEGTTPTRGYTQCNGYGCTITVEVLGDEIVHYMGDVPHYSQPSPGDEWDYEPPDDAIWIFIANQQTALALVEQDINYLGDQNMLPRIALSHLITGLEAYFGDVLRRYVNANSEAITELASQVKSISDQNVLIGSIAKDTDFIARQVREYLADVLYHRLGEVDFLFRTAMQTSIFASKEDQSLLFQSVAFRHHYVHRGGITKDGEDVKVDVRYVQEVAKAAKRSVEQVNTVFNPKWARTRNLTVDNDAADLPF